MHCSEQDKDLFVTKMQIFRPKWDAARIEKEWSYLEALTPESSKRQGGPTESPLQLPIPGWLVGEDGEIYECENFETKSVVSATKGTAWKAEDLQCAENGILANFYVATCRNGRMLNDQHAV